MLNRMRRNEGKKERMESLLLSPAVMSNANLQKKTLPFCLANHCNTHLIPTPFHAVLKFFTCLYIIKLYINQSLILTCDGYITYMHYHLYKEKIDIPVWTHKWPLHLIFVGAYHGQKTVTVRQVIRHLTNL